MSQTLPEIIKQCYRDKTEQRLRHLFRFIMISLLAESKTMSSLQSQVAENIYLEHKPVFESQADAIMDYFSQLSPGEISSMLGISQSLGIKARNLAYDFNYKGTGYKAINGYTGEVFKGLDIDSIP